MIDGGQKTRQEMGKGKCTMVAIQERKRARRNPNNIFGDVVVAEIRSRSNWHWNMEDGTKRDGAVKRRVHF